MIHNGGSRAVAYMQKACSVFFILERTGQFWRAFCCCLCVHCVHTGSPPLILEGWIHLSCYQMVSLFGDHNLSALSMYIFTCICLIRGVIYDLEGRNDADLRGREFGLVKTVSHICRFSG